MSVEEIKRQIAVKRAELEEIDRQLTPLWGRRLELIKEIKELESLLRERMGDGSVDG